MKLYISTFILPCSETYEDSPALYWAWSTSVVAPVVYILAVVHAVLWRLPSAIIGSLVIMHDFLYHIPFISLY